MKTLRGQVSKNMLAIIRAAQIAKSHAYDTAQTERVQLKIRELAMLVLEAEELMDQLKPVQPDDSRQGILLPSDGCEPVVGKVVLIPTEPEEALEQEVQVND